MNYEMISFDWLLFVHIACFLTLLPKIACNVPPDYCLYALNTSDCNETPTPVFYFYKPGSRCEVGFWRGCPTFNKFDDEIDCSSTCIYQFKIDFNIEAQENNWEDEVKNVPSGDAAKLSQILNEILDTTSAPSVPSTETTNAAHSSELQKTTESETELVTGTTVKQELDITETISTTILPTTTVASTGTKEDIVKTEEVTSENIFTTKHLTTDNVITTEVTTANVVITEATTEAPTTTTLTTTVPTTTTPTTTTIKGDPDEVEIMRTS